MKNCTVLFHSSVRVYLFHLRKSCTPGGYFLTIKWVSLADSAKERPKRTSIKTVTLSQSGSDSELPRPIFIVGPAATFVAATEPSAVTRIIILCKQPSPITIVRLGTRASRPPGPGLTGPTPASRWPRPAGMMMIVIYRLTRPEGERKFPIFAKALS